MAEIMSLTRLPLEVKKANENRLNFLFSEGGVITVYSQMKNIRDIRKNWSMRQDDFVSVVVL